jgi:ABC-type antimicrobial peptide transport system permease subunit
MFISRGMLVTATGLAVGLAAALASARLLTTLLFGVKPFDPLTFVLVIVGLGAVALVATWLPARHATSVDPAIALRGE